MTWLLFTSVHFFSHLFFIFFYCKFFVFCCLPTTRFPRMSVDLATSTKIKNKNQMPESLLHFSIFAKKQNSICNLFSSSRKAAAENLEQLLAFLFAFFCFCFFPSFDEATQYVQISLHSQKITIHQFTNCVS